MEKLLQELKVTYEIDFVGYDCPHDIHQRKRYKVTFNNGHQSYTTDFWDSINASYLIRFEGERRTYDCNNYRIKGIQCGKVSDDYPIKLGPVGVGKMFSSGYQQATLVENPAIPDIADILECCELSEPPLSFDDFCNEFGYSNDSIKAQETHRAVLEQYSGLRKVFGESGLEQVWEAINQ